jgi:site-specific DNA-cytosine methylase
LSAETRVILDVFPGWGFFSRPWRESGFPVLWGPDLAFGEAILDWHLPAGIVWGIVGGCPCQPFSIARWGHTNQLAIQHEDMTPEFVRIITEGQPEWFLSENVRGGPVPVAEGYTSQPMLLDSADFGCVQSRIRRFTFGSRKGLRMFVPETTGRHPDPTPCMVAPRGGGRRTSFEKRMKRRLTIADLLRGVGLPENTPVPWPMKKNDGWGQMLSNAVPLPVGRALRDAILLAMDGGLSHEAREFDRRSGADFTFHLEGRRR